MRILLLLILSLSMLAGFSSSSNTKGGNTAPTEADVQQYVKTNAILPLATETLQNEVVILSENGIDSISKDQAGKITGYSVRSQESSTSPVKSGFVQEPIPFVYVVVNDHDLLSNGKVLEVTFADGKTVSQPMNHSRGYLVFHGKNEIKINTGSTFIIKDETNKVLYQSN